MLALLILFFSGVAGGVLIAVAGGGTFVTFPAMVFVGVPAIGANASSAVALFPGNLLSIWAFRREIRGISEVNVKLFAAVSLLGSLAGATLLLVTPTSIFAAVLPWLMLVATSVFAAGNFAPLEVLHRFRLGPRAALAVQFALAIYGGYFGGGLGFMMLAVFTLFGLRDVLAMNGLKLLLAALMSVTAVTIFIFAGLVYWRATIPVLAGALAGSYFGAAGARRVDRRLLTAGIVALGAGLTAYFFWRAYFGGFSEL